MFVDKEIGKYEINLLEKEKKELLRGWIHTKKFSIYGSLICLSLILILLFVFPSARDVLFFFSIVLPLIFLWGALEDYFKVKKKRTGFDYILKTKKVKALRIQSDRFYQLDEDEDEGVYYLFEIRDNTIILFGGQEFYPSKKFPNNDFEIIEGKDTRSNLILFDIIKYGEKIKPIKKLKGTQKQKILDKIGGYYDYHQIEGNLKMIDEFIK